MSRTEHDFDGETVVVTGEHLFVDGGYHSV